MEDFDESEVSSSIKELLVRNVSADSIVVSGAGPESIIPRSMWLPADSKLTTIRNDVDKKCKILFTLHPITDQTGLESINKLEDTDIIEYWKDEDNYFDVIRKTLLKAVKSDFKNIENDHINDISLALSNILTVLISDSDLRDILSLRGWIRYMIEVLELVDTDQGTIDKKSINRNVGKALKSLDLLPDSEILEDTKSIGIRILRNARIVALQHPKTGKEISHENIKNEWIDRWKKNPNKNKEILDRYSIKDVGTLVNKMKLELDSITSSERNVEYELWNEIFTNVYITKLGDRISQELEQFRLAKDYFEQLNLTYDLNNREIEAATTFIDENELFQISNKNKRLIDLLTPRTRKEVMKIAFSGSESSSDALKAILNVLLSFDFNEIKELNIDISDTEEYPVFSKSLFSILYGSTLHRIAEILKQSNFTINIDKNLFSMKKMN